MPWDRVVTVTDFYDRPRGGVAFLGNQLVVYESLWSEERDDYSDEYGVSPIDPALLPLIEEAWSIWIRWWEAFHKGQTGRETHPALPEDRKRHKELNAILDPKLRVDHETCEQFRAEFRSVQSGWNDLEVNWTNPPTSQPANRQSRGQIR